MQRYVDAIVKNDSAFGAYDTVLFRFPVGSTSIHCAPTGRSISSTLLRARPKTVIGAGFSMYYSSGRTPYVATTGSASGVPLAHRCCPATPTQLGSRTA